MISDEEDKRMELGPLLSMMVKNKASDLFITAGREPSMKVDGRIHPVNKTPFTAKQTKALVYGIMTDAQQREFDETK